MYNIYGNMAVVSGTHTKNMGTMSSRDQKLVICMAILVAPVVILAMILNFITCGAGNYLYRRILGWVDPCGNAYDDPQGPS